MWQEVTGLKLVQDISENVYDISVFVWHNLNKLKLMQLMMEGRVKVYHLEW